MDPKEWNACLVSSRLNRIALFLFRLEDWRHMDTEMVREKNPQRIPNLLYGAILGALTSLPVIALSYLGAKAAGLAFIPFDLFDWLARVLPGNVITIGIGSKVKLIGALGIGPTDAVARM